MKEQKCNSFRHNMNIPHVKAGNLLHTGRAIPDAFWVTDNTQCGSLQIGYLSVFVCLAAKLCDSLPQSLAVCAISVRYESTRNHIIDSHSSSRGHEMYHIHLLHLRTTALGSLNCELQQATLTVVSIRAPLT